MKSLLAIALVASLAGCAGGQLSPQAQRAVDTFECYVAAVTPYVGDACDVAELVRDAIQGRADLGRALQLLGNTAEDVEMVALAMKACRAPAPLASEPAEYHAGL